MLDKKDFQGKDYAELLIEHKLVYVPTDDSFIPDNSGLYTLINITKTGNLRIDFMESNLDAPIMSIEQYEATTLYKWVADNVANLDSRHLAYIGYELGRAEVIRDIQHSELLNYTQS